MTEKTPGRWPRVILLADMNAFFASVEQVDHPAWRAKPVAITNGSIGTCIITCSYQARHFGVKTGMHIQQARRICPGLIQAISRPRRYAEVSTQIMQALAEFSPDIEVFSVDEAFLDVTHCLTLWGTPREIALRVKKRVFEVSGVYCSVGVSGDKTTAKHAAKMNKPDGLTIVEPWLSRQYLAELPLTELCGVNTGIANWLALRGVHKCGDLQKLPISVPGRRFGNPGRRIWLMAQGLDPEPVKVSLPQLQSIGHSKVLPPNTQDLDIILTFLRHMSHKLGERLRKHALVSQHFIFGFRLYRGWLQTRLRSMLASDDDLVIYQLGKWWFMNHWQHQGIWQIRIIAVDPRSAGQADLFTRKKLQRKRCHAVMDAINARYGPFTLASARLLERSTMPDVISPSWKPGGPRKTV